MALPAAFRRLNITRRKAAFFLDSTQNPKMPRRTTRRYTKKRKTIVRRKRRAPRAGGGALTMASSMQSYAKYARNGPVPLRMVRWMEFSQIFAISGSSANVFGAQNSYRLNSIFAPYVTGGTSTQPRYYDQFAAFYTAYKVRQVVVEVEFTNTSTVAGHVIVLAIGGRSSLPTLSGNNLDAFADSPACDVLPIGALDGGNNVLRYKKLYNISSLEGITPLQYKADVNVYSALWGANPTRIPFFATAVAPTVGSAINLDCRICMYFQVEMYDRIVISQST